MGTEISVVIPCYNAGRFLGQTLQSVLDQTYPVLEVIVVDDGSTDESALIAKAFGPSVRVIRQENQGESAARNRGIDEALGSWVALLDADDIWENTKLERQVEAIQNLKGDCCCCYTDYFRFQDDRRLGVVRLTEFHTCGNARVAMLFDCCANASSSVVRTDVARSVRFPEDVRFGEDTLFFARLRDRGAFVRVPLPLTGYRISPSQQTGSERRLLESVKEKYFWFQRVESDYDEGEREYVYERIRQQLIACHDRLYWRRHIALARESRRIYTSLFSELPPSSFCRPLYPRWMLLLKDGFDGLSRRDINGPR